MKKIEIRNANSQDVLNLSVLKKQVFISTYALEGIRSDFSRHINAEFSIEKTSKELNDKNKITLIAEHKDCIIGYAEIILNSNCNDLTENSPELSKLYVFEHFKGKGVGYSLISESENIARNKGFQGLWLTVYHLNRNAILFYKKQDYKIIGKTDFEMENQKYENKIMFKKLNK